MVGLLLEDRNLFDYLVKLFCGGENKIFFGNDDFRKEYVV